MSRAEFSTRLRLIFVDEAHCISTWGGTFRPDFELLGHLRVRTLRHVCVAVASATLPEHVLAAVQKAMRLTKDAVRVEITNDRPNIALSVRTMEHAKTSYGDLAFLIGPESKAPGDIDTTLVYCNERLACEEAAYVLRRRAEDLGIDPECIAFYHAKIGEREKRRLEERLRSGAIRILVCSDAVGMGCDMRNIKRVVLWGLPPSFCSLAQRAGRAVRDFTQLGEAVLIVTKPQLKAALDAAQGTLSEADAVVAEHTQSLEDGLVADEELAAAEDAELETSQLGTEGQTVTEAHQLVDVGDGGARVEVDDEPAEAENAVGTAATRRKRGKARVSDVLDSTEFRALMDFVSGARCRRTVWNSFFQNERKASSVFKGAIYKPPAGARCCDVCSRGRGTAEVDFPIPVYKLEPARGALKRGKKRKLTAAFEDTVRTHLRQWRSTAVEREYPDNETITAEGFLDNGAIEDMATAGEQLLSLEQLRGRTRWAYAYDGDRLSRLGQELLLQLAIAYATYDATQTSLPGASAGHGNATPGETSSTGPPGRVGAGTSRARGRGAATRARGRGTSVPSSRGRGANTSSARARGGRNGRSGYGARTTTHGRGISSSEASQEEVHDVQAPVLRRSSRLGAQNRV
jgi:superfamily II DNA/RNA helicase